MKRGTKLAVMGSTLIALSVSMLTVSTPFIPSFDKQIPEPSKVANDGGRTEIAVAENTLLLREAEGAGWSPEDFANPLPSDDSYFPIGVWLASVIEHSDVNLDIETGLNTYVDLTANSDLQLALNKGMYVISSSGSELAHGLVLPDEADMWGGPGDGEWTGNYPGQGPICVNTEESCGYSVIGKIASAAPEQQLLYANFGKGVTFWADNHSAARFVNEYPDIVSADNYWFTDPNICSATEGGTKFSPAREPTASECRNAANYGWTVDRLQSLVSPIGSKPVWSFIEVGHPASEVDAPTITPDEIVKATWSSIVHGARGIIYFNHSFNGACPSHNVMRSCGEEPRATLTSLNSSITSMAKVLNAPEVAAGVDVHGQVDYAVKYLNQKIHVLVTHSADGNGEFQVSVPCANGNQVTRKDTGEKLTVSNASFSDKLAVETPIAIYAIDAKNCETVAQN